MRVLSIHLIIITCFLYCGTARAQPELFEGLVVAPEVQDGSYSRSLYRHWLDADGNGLDARQDVLASESVIPPVIDENNRVTSGLWFGVYCAFRTTNPKALDIDHFIPLQEVHESGGHAWSEDRRRAYANDLSSDQTLIAVKASCNRSKGARDPADWMPPNRAYWCTYLTTWIAVKKAWALTIDVRERDSLAEGLNVCGLYRAGDRLSGRHGR